MKKTLMAALSLAVLAAPSFATATKVSMMTKVSLMQKLGELQKSNFAGIRWNANAPEGKEYVTVFLMTEKHTDAFSYSAMLPVANVAPNAPKLDPNKATEFVLMRQGGFAGVTEYSDPLPFGEPKYGIPEFPKDAFAGIVACQAIDANYPMRVYRADEVLALLDPCLKGVSERYGVTVSASQTTIFGQNGSKTAQIGVAISIQGQVMTGNSVHMDLTQALKQRNGTIRGVPVVMGQ